ncbi:MAG: SAM-dependent methyltransferase [Deltaproteobacteria bacterium]|nr:SAM-dependent methyltransferase [Deltaproteobacteria bacterium]
MSPTSLNLTSSYYTGDHPSLLWEMTVCQSLGDGDGAFAETLQRPQAYGRRLAEFLLERDLPANCGKLVEVGGGYGTLMAALLEVICPQSVTMVDISPRLLALQQQRLSPYQAEFHCQDIFTWLEDHRHASAELIILNEVIGDLPSITEISKKTLQSLLMRSDLKRRADSGRLDQLDETQLLLECARLITAYGLDLAELPECFNFNYGALLVLEMLARTNIKRALITEHGCDTVLPYPFSLYSAISPPVSNRNPRRIRLKDHDEYSIRFDHLEKTAQGLNFTVQRFHLFELLQMRFDDEIHDLLQGRRPTSEKQEIFLEFYEHAAEYQGLYLERRPDSL